MNLADGKEENETCRRANKYINGLENIFNQINKKIIDNYKKLIDAVKRYTQDARYYLEKGDCETALVAASYAEGLIDSLKYLDIIELKWNSLSKIETNKKVFVAGTFDLIHPGHIRLLRFASQFGKVHVVLARDSTVKQTKGKEPVLPEKTRLETISSIRYVYSAILGDESNKMASVVRISPDVIVLGPDQPFDEKELAREASKLLGKEVKVIRFSDKEEFAPGMRGTRDIISKICRETYCLNNL